MEASIDQQYTDQVKEFPCAFNLESTRTLSLARLKHVQHNLEEDLQDQGDCQSEIIRRDNFLTWILFLLGEHSKAAQLNSDCLQLTKSSNVACLGNHLFILLHAGDELGADRCLHDLQKLKHKENYSTLHTEAKAEQAYYYSRLGGPENLSRAIRAFSEAIEDMPDNYLWTFGLGLCYRRSTNANIFCSVSRALDVDRCKTLAADYLFEVAQNADSRLKSLAYAQLVCLQQTHPSGISSVFRGLNIQELCEEALKHGPDIPSVLTHCGNAVREFDVDKSIMMLEKSLTVRKNTIAYHFLGISYQRKEEQEELVKHTTVSSAGQVAHQLGISFQELAGEHGQLVRGSIDTNETREHICLELPNVQSTLGQSHVKETHKATSTKESPKPQGLLSMSVRKCRNDVCLNKDSTLVKQAFMCFKNAIDMSKENAPAILDYGFLLRQTGQLNEALIQFNKVTNMNLASPHHRVSVISAYEQAGLCYIELSKSQECNGNLKEKGKNKLTKAVSLAADLALIDPQLKDCSKEMWTAFRTLQSEIHQTTPSANQCKKEIQLLKLARDHGQIIEVVTKLREFGDDQLSDQSTIETALDSFLHLQQPENAVAFLKLVAIIPAVRDSTWWKTNSIQHLKTKVFFLALSECLTEANENPTPLFQQLFELTVGTRYGRRGHEGEQDKTNFTGDILNVFDDEDDESTDEISRSTTHAAVCVKEVALRLFGLAAEVNLQGSGVFGDIKGEIQLREIQKYPVIIIVMGNEQRSSMFDTILKCVSCSLKPRHLAILTVDADVGLPLCLTQCECLKLDDIRLDVINTTPDDGSNSDQPNYMDIITHVFHRDVNAVLKLFSFMIGVTDKIDF